MTSMLWSWLGAGAVQPEIPSTSISIEEPTEDADGSETEQEDDTPPSFPALNSAQRISSSTTNSTSLPAPGSSSLMPPPPFALQTWLTTTEKPKKPREKVALAPGHSPLDWANLKSSGEDLRGVDTLLRIPPSILKQHRKKTDAWTAIGGKVYNITPYMPFHPGGEKELMRVAGRDGTKLFAETHAWVSADMMLDQCMVGFLVPEPSS
ncbi:cytochrome b5 [Flagelloscypha sp. PMI_526]|nr:cytochrome b5 [Flagelloscypha sp. PMI_526]